MLNPLTILSHIIPADVEPGQPGTSLCGVEAPKRSNIRRPVVICNECTQTMLVMHTQNVEQRRRSDHAVDVAMETVGLLLTEAAGLTPENIQAVQDRMAAVSDEGMAHLVEALDL